MESEDTVRRAVHKSVGVFVSIPGISVWKDTNSKLLLKKLSHEGQYPAKPTDIMQRICEREILYILISSWHCYAKRTWSNTAIGISEEMLLGPKKIIVVNFSLFQKIGLKKLRFVIIQLFSFHNKLQFVVRRDGRSHDTAAQLQQLCNKYHIALNR
ncbi:hypothetical protein LOAG_09073 [Loa loa]|uniref:Uncharacterized protein n=1 Tax=Loa loa TaxID=7209 RepID=A0A1S0TSK9_LOALO|nr:hypothetical protein LOAG_09073 [Loa loa]EFO19418.1 hypothetical protein LOAG_09073 [Loa loa]